MEGFHAISYFEERVRVELVTPDFAERWPNVTVEVVDTLRCAGLAHAAGCYHPDRAAITVSRHGSYPEVIIHELMHLYRHRILGYPSDVGHKSEHWRLVDRLVEEYER